MIVNGDSGHVNTDSGKDRESVHVQPEQVFTMNRNRCSRSTRMSVHDQPDYAPYAHSLKKQITIRIDEDTIAYFKNMAEEKGIPYQGLINLYLRDCAQSRRDLKLQWQ